MSIKRIPFVAILTCSILTFASCDEPSSNSGEPSSNSSEENTSKSTDSPTSQMNEGTSDTPREEVNVERGADVDIENHDELPSSETSTDGSCKDKTIKEQPGECGCQFEDKDIDNDGKIDCPVKIIPENILPKLEDIKGDCGGWEYPKHPVIRYPEMPEYGYEVTIDTEKYKISKVYDVEKANETAKGFAQAIKDYVDAGYTRIIIPAGHYPVPAGGLVIRRTDLNNKPVALIMSNDVTIQTIPHSGWDGRVIQVSNDNVYIEGGTVIGDKYGHTNTMGTDEENGGIEIWNSNNVLINGVKIKEAHGDGVMVINTTRRNEKTKDYKMYNIIIANCEIDDAYRNGIGVVGAESIRISNNYIHGTTGTAPAFGIDLESGLGNGAAIIDHNSFVDNASGDIVLSGVITDTSFIEYNFFSIGDKRKKYNDGSFIPWSKNSFVLYRNIFEKPAPGGGCSGQLTCTYGSRDDDNNLKTYIVENDFPAQRIVLNRYKYLCIKENVSHEGVISVGSSLNLRLLNNRIEKFTDNPVQGKNVDIAIPKDSVKGIASGNVKCTYDEDQNETCQEIEALNAMKEDEFFPGRATQTF